LSSKVANDPLGSANELGVALAEHTLLQIDVIFHADTDMTAQKPCLGYDGELSTTDSKGGPDRPAGKLIAHIK